MANSMIKDYMGNISKPLLSLIVTDLEVLKLNMDFHISKTELIKNDY